MAIKIKVFKLVGTGYDDLEKFINDVGWKNVLSVHPSQDGRGNLGAIVIHEDGEKDK